MKSLITCLLSVLLFTSTSTMAGQKGIYYDYGKVVKVKPVFNRGFDTRSRKKCIRNNFGHHGYYQHGNSQQNNYHGSHKGQNNSKVLPTVAGAVVGGVIGNQLARNSRNQDLATVSGAVIGGIVGHEIADNAYSQSAHKRHHHGQECVSVQEYGHYNGNAETKKLKGYRVTYRYKGEKFTTFTRKHPGGRIKLEISVRPAFYK